MSQEERIKAELTARFAYLADKIKIPRQRRIFLEVDLKDFKEVFAYAARNMSFPHLCTITGLDEREKLSFIYHLAQDNGIILNLKTSVPKENPVLESVVAYYPGAEIYERELADLFGAKIQGLPPGNRYPLTDDWPQGEHPLRKDWKA